MTIELREVAEGIIIPVKATAGARRNEIRGQHNGRLRVSVTAAPEKGQANEAIARLLASAMGLPKSAVRLARGTASSDKQFLLVGATRADAQAKLDRVLPPGS